MSDNILEVRKLKKSFKGFTAVSGVTFPIRRGKIKALIGPTGAGKNINASWRLTRRDSSRTGCEFSLLRQVGHASVL